MGLLRDKDNSNSVAAAGGGIDESDKKTKIAMDKLKTQVRQFETNLSVFKERQRQDYDELTLLEGSLLDTLK